MPKTPVDALSSPQYALEGRIVTMDENHRVLERGVIYVDAGRIAAVLPSGSPAPPDFAETDPIKTGGTIYPGLIELHNHLSYNILRLWDVPATYTNRDQWASTSIYHQTITAPMSVLGRTPGYVEAIVRYVECKCLLGGVTTSQGIALFSSQGITRYYRGIVRNVEDTDDADLPEAATHIADVEATDAKKFLSRLQKSSCLLLHLSEGADRKAHEHFEALQFAPGQWAITSALAGIHCVALNAADYDNLQQRGAAMIWSPLSNLLLYKQTADIKAAKASGIRIGLGSDWAPSGSKSLFGELKVARLVSSFQGGVFSDRELLDMATRGPAEILKWDRALGSIEAGKRADLLVINGRKGDPYGWFFEAPESAISLVVINGVPRYGRVSLMKRFGPATERLRVGNATRMLNLAQTTADPVVGALSLKAARDKLQDGLRRLPELAHDLEHPPARALALELTQPRWFLMLDHDELSGVALRPHLPFGRQAALTATLPPVALAATKPLSEIVPRLELDPLTVADDDTFLKRLAKQRNLSSFIPKSLPALF